MYAIVDYKGTQILLKESLKTRIPYAKDSKVGSTIKFENVLFYDDGKKKHFGNPYVKNMNFQAEVLSHEKDSKILIFKQKRRKGHQKKNGYRDHFTLVQVDKLSTKSSSTTKAKKSTETKTKTKKTSAKAKTKTSTSTKTKKSTTKTTKK